MKLGTETQRKDGFFLSGPIHGSLGAEWCFLVCAWHGRAEEASLEKKEEQNTDKAERILQREGRLLGFPKTFES